MKSLTQFGLKKSRFTVFFMLILLLFGVSSYLKLSKREDPAITVRTAVVSAAFPGMSPQRITSLIAAPIERKARQISEVKDIKTLISTGQTVIYLDLYESTPSEDLTKVFQNIRNKMAEVVSEMPEGTIGPFVNTDYGDVVISSIAITGGAGYNYTDLANAAKALRKKLYTVKGIGKVSLFGEQKERIWLEINSRKLAAVGIQLPQLIQDLKSQNIILSAGNINAKGSTIHLQVDGNFNSLDNVKEVLTKNEYTGALIQLKNLLTVRKGYVEPAETPVYFNGKRAIVLGVQMSKNQDIQVVGKNLKEAVKKFEKTLPIGINANYSTYQEKNVTVAINDALLNVLQTIAVVLLVLVLFLGFKPALIVACIVPFSLMITVIIMPYIGVDLHIVSIAAVIISLGLLVDNGLVIVEDIQGQINQGVEPKAAALGASKQFGSPLIIASITTVAAFLPLLLMEGSNGEYGFALGIVVALMLLASWISSMYFLPFLCVHFSKKKKHKNESNKQPFFLRFYKTLVNKSLNSPLIVIIGAYIIILGGVVLFNQPKSEMFPLSERSQFLIYADFPKGTAIDKTKQKVLKLNQWLLNKKINPNIVNVTSYIGDGGPRFYLSLNPAETIPSSAFLLVNTTTVEAATKAVNRAKKHFYTHFPSGRFKVKLLSMGGAESNILDIKVSGPNADKLLKIAEQIESKIAQAPHIQQNENDWGNKVVKAVVNVAQDKAREYGITSRDIANALNTYVSGTVVSEFRNNDDSIPIVLRSVKESRDSLEDISNITLPVKGKLISLEQIATIYPLYEFSQIRRENQQKTITISAKSGTLSAFELLDFIQPTLNKIDWAGSYSYSIAGEIKDTNEVNDMLLKGFIPALFIMLAALVFQFNSLRRVLLIMLTIPLILIGSPIALIITGQPLSFFATLGLISLAGIIINNAIVLIDQIDLEIENHSLREAIINAAIKRVTPISLTTLTTVIGLVPMALSGGALFEPMATLMIGGLLCASVVSLLFVPSAYYFCFGLSRKKH